MKILAIILVLAASCHAATYYVAVTGNDSNAGSLAAPWLTLSYAATVAVSGDIVTVESGTFTFTQLNLATSGVTFTAQNKWGAILAATNGSSTTPFINLAANSLTFQNFEVIGQPGVEEGIKCNGTSQTNCIIQGNKIHDFGVQNTCLSGAAAELGSGVTTGAQILANYIYNIGPTRTSGSRCNQFHGIYVGGGTAPVVQNNIVFEVWQGYALHINPSSSNMIGGVFTNNTIFNSGDNTGGGTGSASGGPMVLDCHLLCNSNIFNNNIFYNTQGAGPWCFREVQETGATIGSNTFSNNLLNSCGTNLFVGSDIDVNTVTSNPQFVNYTGDQTGDYHLATGSGGHIAQRTFTWVVQ